MIQTKGVTGHFDNGVMRFAWLYGAEPPKKGSGGYGSDRDVGHGTDDSRENPE